jgi:hypothetical protein
MYFDSGVEISGGVIGGGAILSEVISTGDSRPPSSKFSW